MTENKFKVSVLGLGNMGTALASAFIENDNDVTVWNRSQEKAKPLIERGAKLASSVKEAVTVSDVIVICVLNYETSDNLLQTEEIAQLIKGKTIIQLTTGTAKEAKDGSAWATKYGANYVDGAIMGVPQDIGTAGLIHSYSGSKETFDKFKVLIMNLGENPHFVSENPASASALDGALLSFNFGTWLHFIHGAALAESEGISAKIFLQETQKQMNTLTVPSLQYLTDFIEKRDYPGHYARIKTYVAAGETIERFSEENNVNSLLPKINVEIFKKTFDAGYGENDLSSVFEFFSKKLKQ